MSSTIKVIFELPADFDGEVTFRFKPGRRPERLPPNPPAPEGDAA